MINDPESTTTNASIAAAEIVKTQFGQLLVASIGDQTHSITLTQLGQRLDELADGQRRRPDDEVVLRLASELVHSLISENP